MNINEIARVAHEINRAYCEAIGDHSNKAWNEAPLWQQESAVQGVLFYILNPEATAEDIHNNWMKEKVDHGWVYGHVKDAETKRHPCLVPFKLLPFEQQVKDHLFRAVVHTLHNNSTLHNNNEEDVQ